MCVYPSPKFFGPMDVSWLMCLIIRELSLLCFNFWKVVCVFSALPNHCCPRAVSEN